MAERRLRLDRLRIMSFNVRDHAGERYPSDHYPVLADLAS
jgi:endonuclease/exonuclease/phosphatase family metal-dependent hydrolase